MAKYGSATTTVTLDATPGGAAKIITPYVQTISGIGLEFLTQQTNPFGSTMEAHTPTGMAKSADITLTGFFDDAADVGSWTVLKPVAGDYATSSVGRTLVVVCATGATFTIEVHLVRLEILAKNGGLCEYAATLRTASGGAWS